MDHVCRCFIQIMNCKTLWSTKTVDFDIGLTETRAWSLRLSSRSLMFCGYRRFGLDVLSKLFPPNVRAAVIRSLCSHTPNRALPRISASPYNLNNAGSRCGREQ